MDTFSKLIRLSFYTNILSKVPENYKDIFPPKPEPQALEDATPEDRNGDTEMADAEQANRLAGTPAGATAEEQQWAKEFITLVRGPPSICLYHWQRLLLLRQDPQIIPASHLLAAEDARAIPVFLNDLRS